MMTPEEYLNDPDVKLAYKLKELADKSIKIACGSNKRHHHYEAHIACNAVAKQMDKIDDSSFRKSASYYRAKAHEHLSRSLY